MISQFKAVLILSCLLISIGALDFQQKNQVTSTDQDIFSIRFSDDQTYLAVVYKSLAKVVVHNGFTFAPITTWTLNPTQLPQTVAFAHDNSKFAIGTDDGDMLLYAREGEGFSTTAYNSTVITDTNGVVAVEFSADSSILAIGAFGGEVELYDVPAPTTNEKNRKMFQLKNSISPLQAGTADIGAELRAVAFSPKTGNLFVAGGDASSGAILSQFDSQNNWALLGNVTVTDQVQGMTFDTAGDFLYTTSNNVAGDSNVDVWQTTNFNLNTTLEPQGGGVNAMYEVLITKNGLYVAAAGNTNVYTWQRTQPNEAFVANAPFPSVLENIALSKSYGDLVVVRNDGAGGVKNVIDQFGLCLNTNSEFYDEDANTCNPCDASCGSCSVNSTFCFTCNQKFFLNANACDACVVGCLDCADATTCTTCDDAGNWTLNTDTNVCDCKTKFFRDNDQCASCIVGCEQLCNAATCTTCDDAGNFEKNDTDNTCVCKKTFFLNVNQCDNCGLGCNTCDGTACQECNADDHFIINPAGGNDCICNDAQDWVLNATVCECRVGFFDDKNGSCTRCPNSCSTCQSATNCQTCSVPQMGDPQDGVCLCPAGAFFDDADLANLACVNCNATVQFCTACTGNNSCTTCDNTLNRKLNAGTGACDCDRSFFDNAGVCDACGIGCGVCTDATTCQECKGEDHWTTDGATGCICQTRYIQLNNVCEKCTDRGCLICVNDQDTCSECDEQRNWIEVGPDCACSDRHYDDGDLTCELCNPGCTGCVNAKNNCISCMTDAGFIVDETTDKGCKCDVGTYPSTDILCAQCAQTGCRDCDSATNCIDCYSGFSLDRGVCSCPPERYPDGIECVPCIQPCQTCEAIDKCLTCISGWSLKQGTSECLEDGLSILVIVLICVGGLAVIGAAFAIIKYCRKKKSPLEEEGEYEPVE